MDLPELKKITDRPMELFSSGTSCSLLVIGYGNTLRQDDGVGQRVAETIATWQLTGVRSLAVHQLTPDLAAEMAVAQQVVFVDAMAVRPEDEEDAWPAIKFKAIEPEAGSLGGHAQDPRSLLHLTQVLYQVTPPTFQILIPALEFDFGETLSPLAEAGVEAACQKLKEIIHTEIEKLAEY